MKLASLLGTLLGQNSREQAARVELMIEPRFVEPAMIDDPTQFDRVEPSCASRSARGVSSIERVKWTASAQG